MGSSDVDFFIHSYYEFKLFGVTLSINTTMVTTVIVCLILLALILFARHEIMKDYDEPNVVQNVVEMIVEKMDAMVVSNMGIHAKKYLNYVEALMAFIFLSNISGLFGLRPPTADFGTTFGLALITFVMIEYAWIKTKGFGIIKDLLDPFPVFLPINIISEFATPVSMSLRFVLFKLFLSFAMGVRTGSGHFKKAFYGGQDALPDPTEGQKAPVLSIDPVLSLRRAWEGKDHSITHLFLQCRGEGEGRPVLKIGVHWQQQGVGLRMGQDLLQREGLLQGEAGGHGAPQGEHGPAAAQGLADVVTEGADIGALGAAHTEQEAVRT